MGKAIGEKDEIKVKNLTSYGLVLSLVLGLFITALGFPTIVPFFTFLGATEDLIPLIKDYMELWYIGVPLIIVPIIGNSAIRAQGNTLIPAIIMGVCVVFNIFLIMATWGIGNAKMGHFWCIISDFFESINLIISESLFSFLSSICFRSKNSHFKRCLKVAEISE